MEAIAFGDAPRGSVACFGEGAPEGRLIAAKPRRHDSAVRAAEARVLPPLPLIKGALPGGAGVG